MEAVPDPGLGEKILRSRRILLDLLSQLIYEYPQVLDLVSVIGSPDRLQQLRVGNRHVRMRHQILQKLELFRREPRLAASHGHSPQAEIDFDIIEFHYLGFA